MRMNTLPAQLRMGFTLLTVAALTGCGTIGGPSGKEEPAATQVVTPAVKKAPPPPPEAEIEVSPLKEISAPQVEEVPQAAEPAKTEEPAPVVEMPTEPNTYLIQLVTKDKTHPSFGDGHKMGFAVNGVQGDDIVVKRGDNVTFRVRTDVKHDFYLSTNVKGWGAAVYREGVEGQFTYQGDVTLKVTDKTPDTLYYQCRNHPSMGGRVVVVNADADMAKVKAKLAEERKARLAAAAKRGGVGEVSEAKAKQKVSYAEMMLRFKGKMVAPEAAAAAKQGITEAKKALTAGDFATAYAKADAAAKHFAKPTKRAGSTAEELAEQKAEYEKKLASLRSFQESHEKAYKAAQKDKDTKAVDYDRAKVDEQIKKADGLAGKQQYNEAMKVLGGAERAVTEALNGMLGSKTLVYEVKFDTPKEEYEYEVKRYQSYAELIPVALEVKKPRPGAIKLMERYKEKGEFFAEKSKESAAAGRWEEAIVVIKDATKEVRRGLMLLGVSM